MVRATIFASALFALVAVVAARPASPLVNVDGGRHIGTGDINADNLGQNVVNANDLQANDIVYDVNVASGDDESGRHGHDGLLGHLLKREEAPAGTVRISKQKGTKRSSNKVVA